MYVSFLSPQVTLPTSPLPLQPVLRGNVRGSGTESSRRKRGKRRGNGSSERGRGNGNESASGKCENASENASENVSGRGSEPMNTFGEVSYFFFF